jgi:hypothetical protein
MSEKEAIQRLSKWEPKVGEMNFPNNMTFTEYHLDRIKRENDGSWDNNQANQYVIGLIWKLEEKYGDKRKSF